MRTVRLPATLDPRVVAGWRVYGFLELPTGEVAIGVADAGDAAFPAESVSHR